MELTLSFAISIFILSFILEYLDTMLGMGYGTTLAPLLLLMGFAPIDIVPAILFSECVTGFLASVLFHRNGQVHFGFKFFQLSLDLKIAMILIACSVIGPLSAVLSTRVITPFWQSMYVGLIVMGMGIFILSVRHTVFSFSWKRLASFGLFASFNKGFTGAGYGPLIMGGQLLTGVSSTRAVGISALAEGVTSLVGLLAYFWVAKIVHWELGVLLFVGALLATPLSVRSVLKIHPQTLKVAIAVFSIVLGAFTLIKIGFHHV